MVVVNIAADSQDKQQTEGQIKQGKPFLALKVTGTVKWFNVKCGYGFINRKDTGEDVFVHQSAIVKNNPKKAVRSVGDGETVEFDVVCGEKGNEAANVTGPGGEAVKGSPYAADKRRGYRQWFFRGRGGGRRPGPPPQPRNDGNEEEGTGNRDEAKPRRYRNRRFMGSSYPRRQQSGDKNGGEKSGGEGGDESGGGGMGEDGGVAPRGRGRGRRFRYPYRGRGGKRRSQSRSGTQDGEAKENQVEGNSGGPPTGRGGRGGGRGRPRYRRTNRAQDKQAKIEPGEIKPEPGEVTSAPPQETTQAVQNTVDESTA